MSTVQAAITTKLDAAWSKAAELQSAGHLSHAEQLYQAILQADPRHAAANHSIGMLKVQAHRPAEGLPHLMAALETRPELPAYWLGVLEALMLAERADEAKSTLALARQHGLSGAAVEEFARKLAAAAPGRAQRRGEQRALRKQERALDSLIQRRKFTEALALARDMTVKFPDSGLAFKVVGAFLSTERRFEDALAPLETAVGLLPQDAEAHVNLGLNLVKLDRLDAAETHLKQAIELDPNLAGAHFRLAMVYGLRNRYAEAEACLRNGLRIKSDYVARDGELSYSSFLFIVSHNPLVGADELFAKHRHVGDLFESKFRNAWPRHANARDPNRILKVGFVSGDFYYHAVASFIEPVLEHLKHHQSLELHAYYNNIVEDAVFQRLRGHFAHWHSIAGIEDSVLEKQIAADGIDILVDLSGHSAYNRLSLFARKPAPIQVSWIGYPGTTGLRAMDYYLADRFFLPPGAFDSQFTEKIAYLPANAPFLASDAAPPVNALPALAAGHLCFASFNRLGKINTATLELWSALLRAVPDATMLVGAIELDVQERSLREQFQGHGIAPERLTFHRRCNMDVYLKLHHEVDLCLDTFPYTGGTTTIQALWMGVPTLTIAGPTPASRQGAAILGQLGLDDFIAADADDLAAKGRYWANHLTELAAVRAELRSRWQKSPARQPELIAAGLEQVLRQMWQRWCAGLAPESF